MIEDELRTKVCRQNQTTVAFCEKCELKEKYEKLKEINKELVDENQELQEQNRNLQVMLQAEREVRCNEEYLKRVCELEEQIEQAKKIIGSQKRALENYISSPDQVIKNLIEQAEQFLKEIEK